MATFSVTITIPDNQITNALTGMQRSIPPLQGEGNLAYIKRVTKLLLADAAIEGLNEIARTTIAVTDPGITTS